MTNRRPRPASDGPDPSHADGPDPRRAARPDPSGSAANHFRRRFGRAPAGVWSSAGRVNLIGEHTDHQRGLVLPFAIEDRAAVAVGPNPDGVDRVSSAEVHDGVHTVTPDDLHPGHPATRGWQGYVWGVVWALRDAGFAVPALDIALSSTVPAGAGLSSSAAVECATALAISDLAGLGLPLGRLARIAQRAENDFVGVPCGLMDQMASAASTAGHALFFDVDTGVLEHIPFDPRSAGLDVLVIDTRVHHSLADGEYARRRADCEEAAAALGLAHLSALAPGDLDAALARLDADRLRRRVRHVVTENDRVRQVVALLRDNRTDRIGPQLTASHASLRDDFAVSCAELDLAAATAEQAGALGARMVGGGFGGSVIALAPRAVSGAVEDSVIAAFEAAGLRRPTVRSVTPASGARRDA